MTERCGVCRSAHPNYEAENEALIAEAGLALALMKEPA